jgi:hypothetical protein
MGGGGPGGTSSPSLVSMCWITGVGQPTHATLIDNDEAVAFIEKPHTQRGMANYTSKGVNQTTSNWI